MKVTVIASTKQNYVASKEELENFGGHAAGVCYMPENFEDLMNEDKAKTDRRVNQTKQSGHHSVYDHEFISLQLEDIPKALAMVLNNEKMYTTSEKSARYTKMVLKEDEQILFDKWLEIFEDLFRNEYAKKYPQFFTEKKLEKLAQENARYLISVFTPTSMIYTCSYRQLNNIYSFLQQEINRENQNEFYKKLKPAMQSFCDAIKNNTPYFDELLSRNEKQREFSLVPQKNINSLVEYYGDIYLTKYKGSFAELAQAQRHRTLSYNFSLLDNNEFFVPPILKDKPELVDEWIKDCNKQAKVFPQGMLINIAEMGTLDNFILKMKERKCTFAQLEINNQTDATLKKYLEQLKATNHPRASELEKYTHGSRCTFPDYNCPAPCGIKEGINGTRKF